MPRHLSTLTVCPLTETARSALQVFTQSLLRSAPMFLCLISLALYLWGRHVVRKVASLGLIGTIGCVFLVTQDMAITAGFLLTKVSNVAFIINVRPTPPLPSRRPPHAVRRRRRRRSSAC